MHVGNPSRFGHGHSAHRLPARDLPEGVLLAEGTFFIALWMDHRRECLNMNINVFADYYMSSQETMLMLAMVP